MGDEQMVMLSNAANSLRNGASTKKGTKLDLAATCGIEGPASAGRIVGSGVVCIDTTGGKGTCNGDSGGPLTMKYEVTKAGQKWKQVGIVSFGASAGCEVGYP